MKTKSRRATWGILTILFLAGAVPTQGFTCEECFLSDFCIPVGDGGFANCFVDEVDLTCTTFENPNTGELETICITEFRCMNTEFCGTAATPPPLPPVC